MMYYDTVAGVSTPTFFICFSVYLHVMELLEKRHTGSEGLKTCVWKGLSFPRVAD